MNISRKQFLKQSIILGLGCTLSGIPIFKHRQERLVLENLKQGQKLTAKQIVNITKTVQLKEKTTQIPMMHPDHRDMILKGTLPKDAQTYYNISNYNSKEYNFVNHEKDGKIWEVFIITKRSKA